MIRCVVNGSWREIQSPPMSRLLDVLREELGLTGTKEGCGEGECGACAVLIDGELANSCMVPVKQVENERVTTIEGLEAPRLQQAFVDHGGVQCGMCTPGLILAAWALLERYADPTLEQMRDALSGNLCRCGSYARVYECIRQFVEEAKQK